MWIFIQMEKQGDFIQKEKKNRKKSRNLAFWSNSHGLDETIIFLCLIRNIRHLFFLQLSNKYSRFSKCFAIKFHQIPRRSFWKWNFVEIYNNRQMVLIPIIGISSAIAAYPRVQKKLRLFAIYLQRLIWTIAKDVLISNVGRENIEILAKFE